MNFGKHSHWPLFSAQLPVCLLGSQTQPVSIAMNGQFLRFVSYVGKHLDRSKAFPGVDRSRACIHCLKHSPLCQNQNQSFTIDATRVVLTIQTTAATGETAMDVQAKTKPIQLLFIMTFARMAMTIARLANELVCFMAWPPFLLLKASFTTLAIFALCVVLNEMPFYHSVPPTASKLTSQRHIQKRGLFGSPGKSQCSE